MSQLEDVKKARKVFQDIADTYGKIEAELDKESPDNDVVELLTGSLFMKLIKIKEL